VLKKNFGVYTLRVNGGNEAVGTECSRRQGTKQIVARCYESISLSGHFVEEQWDSKAIEKRMLLLELQIKKPKRVN